MILLVLSSKSNSRINAGQRSSILDVVIAFDTPKGMPD
jgi:hypothetical protein